jgi:flagellar motor component MotA
MMDRVVRLRQSAGIARSTGVVAIALGFILGMQGLDEPESIWLRTAQALIVTGLLAQGYALWCTVRGHREQAAHEDHHTRGKDDEP